MADWITGIVEAVGYAGIALLMLAEMWVPVVQSEIVMTFAGFAARDGGLSLAGAVAAGVAGTQAGGLTLYAACRVLPEERLRSLLERHGAWLGLGEGRLDRLEQRFRDHAVRTVVLGRFLPGVRGVIAVPAGLLGMGFWRFLLASLPGAVGWTAGLTVAGYLLGSQYRLIERYSTWASAVFGLGLAALLGWWLVRVHRERAAG